MNIPTIVIAALIAAAAVAIVVCEVRKKLKNRGGCSCGCAGCSLCGSCGGSCGESGVSRTGQPETANREKTA